MTAPSPRFVDHLRELRMRLLWSLFAVALGAVVVWIFFDEVFGFLERPYCSFFDNSGVDCSFLITDVLDPFSISLTVAGYGGVILALPVIFYHLARFVTPALYKEERRIVYPFVVVGVVLFVSGAVGGYLLLPQAIDVLLNFQSQETFQPTLRAQGYLSFFIKMMLAFGLAAELPLILVFLQKVGVLSAATLRKNRRIAILLIVIFGAMITPTGDPFMLLAISLPMYILFEVSILIGARMKRGAKNGPD